MERSPIYQTCSTRVLYYHRSHQAVAKYILAVVLLVLLGALLGRGLPLAKHTQLPLAPARDAGIAHRAVIDRLVAPTLMATTRHAQAPLATSSVSIPQLVATPTAMPSTPNGQQWQVVNTGGLGLCLRPNHDLQSPPIKVLPDGALVTVLDRDVVVAHHSWRHVSIIGGLTGWVASDYLASPQ